MSALAAWLYLDSCGSPVCVISCIPLFGGVRMSNAYILNRDGDSTPPCGTPVFISACFDFVLLYVLNCLRLRM